ncbi:MFS transporter [Pseudoroseomonas wenyumeiae]|uniref:MFS transporter n=1 Tax=Teichococcus wenyumeiae TaxID=2478470 RepID=A0A3A9JU14_9PROT|nr:MFS transporter [Pseudoroseomonas wenyumeiae]RKK02489.1 MFS transporter [Pseudoroseomonas wenyumeiae]RMI25245.1 MFS transporter [Pseudoroseomonas wenyumeiae]
MNNREGSAAFVAPLLVLALGHMISNLLRTLPAISADVLARDIGTTPEGLASLTGAYHLTFAMGQIPLGVALDRFGVKPVALTLLGIVTLAAAASAMVSGPVGFLLTQVALGLGSCGALLCPMTLAAKILSPAKFGLWSGLIQGTGNAGMLLSASPLAWVVEHSGWRAGFWVAAGLALVVALLVAKLVPAPVPAAMPPGPRPSLLAEAREVIRLGLSRRLRGLVLLAFASFAVIMGLRGLWGGPWLMEVKGLSRIEAGNLLLLFTVALIGGAMLSGMLDRILGHRRLLLALGHAGASLCLLLLVAGGPGGWLSEILGVPMLPAAYDAALFLAFGLAITVQPLAFAMTRALVPPEQAGKALSAVNLSFFLGTAVLQAASGPVAAAWGIGAALVFLALANLVCTAFFMATTRQQA